MLSMQGWTLHGPRRGVGRGPWRCLRRGRSLGLSRGLSRGPSRGLSLFGSLLALGLLGMMVVAAVLFLDRWMLEERARIAARQLTVLTHAAESHVSGRFPAVLEAVNVGPAEITVGALKSAGALPAGFPDVNALGRGYRVLMLAGGADALDLLVTETVPAGDTAVPAAALLATDGRTRMGLVAPDLPRRLAGPVVDTDVGAFQAAFGGAPAARALATLRRLDHREVYGDQLYRVAVPGFADANRMETDLDLGGNDLTGAGNVEAETLTLESDLTVGGDLTVADGLMVGRALHVSGPAEVGEGITAAGARIAGTATAGSLTVTHELRAAGMTAQGAVSAGSVGVQGTVAAGSASLTGLQSDGVTARTVTATQVSAAEATAMAVRATARANAAEAGFSRLVVGTCTGC